MATICNQLNTEFTPAAGQFRVTVVGGDVRLMAKGNAGAPATSFASAGTIAQGTLTDVNNPSGDSVYRFEAISGSPSVIATQ